MAAEQHYPPVFIYYLPGTLRVDKQSEVNLLNNVIQPHLCVRFLQGSVTVAVTQSHIKDV